MIGRFKGQYEFLSNFYPSIVMVEGYKYRTVEHAFQACKTLDPDLRKPFRKVWEPGDAKKMGRRLKLRSDWESIKISVMADLLRQKFGPGTELRELLIDTGDQKLVEGNWWGDTFWGVYNGRGDNNLGKLLMKLRKDIRAK